MNRIDKKFRELKKKRKKAFIAYIAAGDPSMAKTEKMVLALEKAGADIVELGVPFSDPMADGPTIQQASERSLKNGTNINSIIKLVRSVRKKSDLPLALMSYFNPVYRYGVKRFVEDTKAAGVDGVIIPDLPPEEAGELLGEARRFKYSCIFLLAPTSTAARVGLVSKKSTGFVYYVSLTGVTGVRDKLPEDIVTHVRGIKRKSSKPLCVGFGVSNERQIRMISKVADGVIVGSAIIKIIEKNLNNPDLVKKVSNFVSRLAKAMK